MHTLLIATSLLLALVGCLLCLLLLRFATSAVSRRVIQITGLLVPAFALALLSVLMTHFLVQVCFLTAAPTDVLISQALTIAGALGIMIASALNLARTALLPVQLKRRTWRAPAHLQSRLRGLARSLGMTGSVSLRISLDSRPWALAAGLSRPQIVVSSGLVALLDDEELDAVLCHELLHISRRDLWWTLICGVLRDLTWFLPTTRIFYRAMREEQEIACDDRLVGASRRLALASALVRVRQMTRTRPPTPRGALGLISPGPVSGFEARVRRLIEAPGTPGPGAPLRAVAVAGALLLLFAVAQVFAAGSAMQAMGCGVHELTIK